MSPYLKENSAGYSGGRFSSSVPWQGSPIRTGLSYCPFILDILGIGELLGFWSRRAHFFLSFFKMSHSVRWCAMKITVEILSKHSRNIDWAHACFIYYISVKSPSRSILMDRTYPGLQTRLFPLVMTSRDLTLQSGAVLLSCSLHSGRNGVRRELDHHCRVWCGSFPIMQGLGIWDLCDLSYYVLAFYSVFVPCYTV